MLLTSTQNYTMVLRRSSRKHILRVPARVLAQLRSDKPSGWKQAALYSGDKTREFLYHDPMKYLCGIDEAGRGPLAGPVTAAAAVLPDDFPFELLKDSKKMSEQTRNRVGQIIRNGAVAWSVAWVSPSAIDAMNIHQASLLAMKRAYDKLPDWVRDNCEVVVDGKYVPDIEAPSAAVVRGDSLVHEIMAASILAKTARDAWMVRIAGTYPEWGFHRHKGYPTPEHLRLCAERKLTPIHRRTFTASFS